VSGDIANPSEYKVYWFSRDLVASRFGSYAGKEADALRDLAQELEAELDREGTRVADHEQIIEDRILDSVTRIYAGDISKRYRQTEDLVERIQRRIESVDDIRDFILASRSVVRTSEILDETPRFDSNDIERIVDETLTSPDGTLDPDLAYDALYEVDFEGEALQLGAQREPLIDYVSELMQEPQTDASDVSDAARVVSGIVQEYERRAGQSRAATAGNVLETALQHAFDRFGVSATGVPEHFGDIEVDNIAEGPEGKIGFSCKRTLRERFRQSLSRQAEIGVDEIWFVALMVADVSRDKLVDIRNDGGRMYVPRDSFVWERYSDDEELEYVLRPADDFLTDVSDFTGSQLEY
jgi:hypothetical protein